MIDTQSLATVVDRLTTTCADSAKGFAEASRDVRSEGLRKLLSDAAVQRKQFVRELQTVAKAYGDAAPPSPTGTVAGTVHRGWMQLKAVLTGGSDNAILAACLSEEQSTTLQAYREALEKPLPEDLRTLFERHFESVLRVSRSLLQWQQGIGCPQETDPY
jgi:uncharacterized protein (TIGR02284 family)